MSEGPRSSCEKVHCPACGLLLFVVPPKGGRFEELQECDGCGRGIKVWIWSGGMKVLSGWMTSESKREEMRDGVYP